ncbi:nucleotidyltransferase family protein [Telluribacter sp. SYSU D00476]|uniref:nucleotidyltransferase family protein n=1 Tax=Telluribacter sp. SYSU D00476 TaxID=2811430 RepID=UPI001FF665F9|nr:nucleotidyltransferase family protein [Telluribacter sp. SYSU D00476]
MEQEVKEKIVGYLRATSVQRAYIFGSYARDEQTTDSDVDLLLDFDPETMVSLFDLGRILEDLKELLGKDVDVVTEDGLSPYLRPFIEKDKKLIYEKPA